jgi:hypothetical protein
VIVIVMAAVLDRQRAPRHAAPAAGCAEVGGRRLR